MEENMMAGLDQFDPTAALGFDEEYVEYVPPIEKPEDYDAPQVKEEIPAPERIEATFKGMPGNEKLLIHVIDYCRDGKDSVDVHEEIERFVGSGVCTYAPEVICANLVAAGALEMVADQDVADAADVESAELAPAAEEAPEGELEPIGAPPAFSYVATADGLAVVDAQNPEDDRIRFLEEGQRYLPVYKVVLEACASEGGATKKDIDALVDHHPLCAEPRRYSGFFVKGLEGIDAIAFDTTWKTTEIGRELLAGAAFSDNE